MMRAVRLKTWLHPCPSAASSEGKIHPEMTLDLEESTVVLPDEKGVRLGSCPWKRIIAVRIRPHPRQQSQRAGRGSVYVGRLAVESQDPDEIDTPHKAAEGTVPAATCHRGQR